MYYCLRLTKNRSWKYAYFKKAQDSSSFDSCAFFDERYVSASADLLCLPELPCILHSRYQGRRY